MCSKHSCWSQQRRQTANIRSSPKAIPRPVQSINASVYRSLSAFKTQETTEILKHIGATTAEKLEGTSVRWINTDPLHFPPPSFPCLPLLLQPSSFNPSISYSSFPLPLNFSYRRIGGSALSSQYCPAKMTTSRKSWRGPNTIRSHGVRSGGDASHGSHGAAAPILKHDMQFAVCMLIFGCKLCTGCAKEFGV